MQRYEDLDNLIIKAEGAVRLSGAHWSFNLSRKALPTEIAELERDIGVRLPPSYRDFLLVHNGAHFSIDVKDSVDWSYSVSILPITKVRQATLEIRNTLMQTSSQRLQQNELIVGFAAYGDGSDRCLLNGMLRNGDNEFAVTDAFHEAPGEWTSSVIAGSFDEWLRNMFEAVISRQSLLEYWIPTRIAEA